MKNNIILGPDFEMKIEDFYNAIFQNKHIVLSNKCTERLDKARNFIDYILKNNLKVYGISTGLADLKNTFISTNKAKELSCNLIRSHDAGIGTSLSHDIVKGAMLVRANSLAKGFSGFTSEALQILVSMINNDIIPEIPNTGSLGASGDLAYFARLGRAMMGEEVDVWHKGIKKTASQALKECKIKSFIPLAKEGLALLNGTSFMTSMLCIAFMQEIHALENILAFQALFLNSARVIDTAFNKCIHSVRKHQGQSLIASILSDYIKDSPFVDQKNIQDDYCIRCIPQIFGAKIQIILTQKNILSNELNAATDNPLLFCNEEISGDVSSFKQFLFNGDKWAILSGGNFHGENIATVADCIATANAKIALTMERQITYVLNPNRNKNIFPFYLIPDSAEIGVNSGFMIPQYVANAITQKICQLGIPSSIFNITSANESEDIVSYGASACQRLLEQLDLIEQLNTIYFTTMLQAYSLARTDIDFKNGKYNNLICEKIFQTVISELGEQVFPIISDQSYDKHYKKLNKIIKTSKLNEIINFPISSLANMQDIYLTLSKKNKFNKFTEVLFSGEII